MLFAVRFLTGLPPLTCLGATSDLERIFASQISLRPVAVTPLPGLLACRSWQAAFGLVWELCHTDCWKSSYPDIRRQGRVLVSQQLFRSIFTVFLEENLSYCLGIFTKMRTGFSTSSRARVFSRLKLVWQGIFAKNSFTTGVG